MLRYICALAVLRAAVGAGASGEDQENQCALQLTTKEVPPFVVRGTDPCVPVAGQQVVVGSREEFEYVPSALEKEWTEHVRKGQICDLALKQKEKAALWLNYSTAVFKPIAGQLARDPEPDEAEVLSYFLDKDKKRQYIEPLSGVARHPHAICPGTGGVDKFDIRYLVLGSHCGRAEPKPRTKLFDLGCTTNAGGDFLSMNYDHGSGLGPSIPLFFNMFKDRCLEFDDIYGWEARSMDQAKWWDPVPDEIRERTRFYNVPVEETPCAQSINGVYAQKGSFLHMLKQTAKQEDYVVVKVDIDGGPELNIMEAIARHPELSSLVDEIFFEYHFWFDGRSFGWGDISQERDVDSALDLMKRLRLAGIRAHFWI